MCFRFAAILIVLMAQAGLAAVVKGPILQPDNAPPELQFAAEELATHIKLMTGQEMATAVDPGGELPAGKRLYMRFGALDDEGRIYINGRLAHHRRSIDGDDWQQSFEFDITDFIRPGDRNTVAVEGRNDYGKGGLHKPVAVYVR